MTVPQSVPWAATLSACRRAPAVGIPTPSARSYSHNRRPSAICGWTTFGVHVIATAGTESKRRSTWMRSTTVPTRSIFAACVNDAGQGRRRSARKGPFQSADECHALLEWSGQPGLDAVRKMVTDRLPFGVVEMKTAWVTDDPERSRQLTSAIGTHTASRDGAAGHSVHRGDGGFTCPQALALIGRTVVATKIPATPYPDHRYRTKMTWWDRRTFAKHADPKQLSSILHRAERAGITTRGRCNVGRRRKRCDELRHQ